MVGIGDSSGGGGEGGEVGRAGSVGEEVGGRGSSSLVASIVGSTASGTSSTTSCISSTTDTRSLSTSTGLTTFGSSTFAILTTSTFSFIALPAPPTLSAFFPTSQVLPFHAAPCPDPVPAPDTLGRPAVPNDDDGSSGSVSVLLICAWNFLMSDDALAPGTSMGRGMPGDVRAVRAGCCYG